MNQQLTQIKHQLNIGLLQMSGIVQKYWYKILIVLVITWVITRKDLNLQLNLVSIAGQTEAPLSHNFNGLPTETSLIVPIEEEEPAPVKMGETESSSSVTTPVTKKPEVKPSTPTKPKDNRAQSFSNLGFILNPTYAKRHNVSPEIVKEKLAVCENYVNRFADIAVQEMKDYGIPASITLAQGLLESNAGDSRLAREANNHFGIKCFSQSCANGHCRNYTDDSHKDFFRNYKNPMESYRSHSLFLQRSRYVHLKKLNITDYKGWAHGLKKAGYATDKKYGNKLIKIIEELKLYQYDKK